MFEWGGRGSPTHIPKLEARGCITGTCKSMVFKCNSHFLVPQFLHFLKIVLRSKLCSKCQSDSSWAWSRHKMLTAISMDMKQGRPSWFRTEKIRIQSDSGWAWSRHKTQTAILMDMKVCVVIWLREAFIKKSFLVRLIPNFYQKREAPNRGPVPTVVMYFLCTLKQSKASLEVLFLKSICPILGLQFSWSNSKASRGHTVLWKRCEEKDSGPQAFL